MSDDPHARTREDGGKAHPGAWGEPSSASYQEDAVEEEYHAAEWHYDPTAYKAAPDLSAYYQTEDGDDDESPPVDLRQNEAEGASPASGSQIAPRPNMRIFGRRPGETPKDTEAKILAISAQLQELLAQRQEEAESNINSNAVLGKRTGFKPAGVIDSGQRLPSAPPISLPLRPLQPPKDAGWPGLGRPRTNWGRPVLLSLLGAAIAGGGYWGGRLSAPATGATAPITGATTPGVIQRDGPAIDSASWTTAELTLLDQVLKADRSGDLETAFKLATGMSHTAKNAPGLRAYLTNLETRHGNAVDAEGDLTGSPDLSTAWGAEQMAFIAARSRDFDKTLDWLNKGILLDPFSAQGFYRLGESLRRKGQLADAADRLEEALLRIPAEAEFTEQREWVALKLRLAQLESGHREEFASDLGAQMKSPAPSGYWSLTAAAVALQDGDIAVAANWLASARASLQPERFSVLLGDYFFRAFADRTELAPYFAGAAEMRQRQALSSTAYFIDP